MNINIKEKLAGKGAYIALALLLAAILTFTVIAIVSTVNKRNDDIQQPDQLPGENNQEEEKNDDKTDGENNGENNGDNNEAGTGGENTDDEVNTEPEETVYVVPCEGYVNKDYSEDMLVFSQTMNDHRIHLGIDISGNVGDKVMAFSKGVVEKIYSDAFMGKTIVISHGNGLKSYYMNLADTIPDGIKEGVTVEAGTVIGAIGETAISESADSPHLHFEVRLSDKKVDPKNYVTLPSSAETDTEYEG